MNSESRVKASIPWLLWILLQSPALHPLFKYAPMLQITVPLFLLSTAGATWFGCRIWRTARVQRIVETPWPTVVVILMLGIAAFFIYPIADAMKESGRGSDADNAMIDAANSFWHGSHMYDVQTYFSNPISPGPGWILLVSPLVLASVYWMLTPLMLGILAQVLRHATGSWRTANAVSLLVVSSLAWWRLVVVGDDLPAIGLALAIGALLTYAARSRAQVLCVAVLIGVLATGRIVLFYLPVLYALMLWPRDRRLAVSYALLGLAVCLGLNLWFASTLAQEYPPLHVVNKGTVNLHLSVRIALLLLVGGVGIHMLRTVWHARSLNLQTSLWLCWLGIFTPLCFVAFADLFVAGNGQFAEWTASKMLMPPLALGVTLLGLKLDT